jgi:hypothetical protein
MDVGHVAGLADDGTPVGVADEDDRALDQVEHLAGAFDVVGKRGERVLDGEDLFVAALVQLHDDFRPVGGAAPKPWTRTMAGLTVMVRLSQREGGHHRVSRHARCAALCDKRTSEDRKRTAIHLNAELASCSTSHD